MSPSAITPKVTPRTLTWREPSERSTSSRSKGVVWGGPEGPPEAPEAPEATFRAEDDGPRLFRPSRG